MTSDLLPGLDAAALLEHAQRETGFSDCRQNFRAILDDPMIDDPLIHHVRYPDFVRDPVSTIRTFYGKYGIPSRRKPKPR